MSLSTINDNALFELVLKIKNNGYNFVTITPAASFLLPIQKQKIVDAQKSIERVNSRSENLWAKCITDVLGWSRSFKLDSLPFTKELFESMEKAGIVTQNADKNCGKSLIRISTLDKEVFIHSAYPTEADDSVFFGPDTYRFARTIKSMLREQKQNVQRAVDIGCGAGPGAILLAKAYPNAEIFGIDINENALRFAKINAKLANVNVKTHYSNLLNDIDGQFDIIISNPPYLNDPLERTYRHGGGSYGSALSVSILKISLDRLSFDGVLLLYTASAIINSKDIFFEEAKSIIENGGTSFLWTYEEIDPDVFGEELLCNNYSNVDRIAAVVLTIQKSNKQKQFD